MDVNYMTIKYKKFENICVVLDQSQPQSIFGDTIKGTKIQFIDFISNAFKWEKINVIQNDGDADVMIVTEAIKLAAENAITVFFHDTNVLVLLMYLWSPFICDIHFNTEKVVNKKKIQKQ